MATQRAKDFIAAASSNPVFKQKLENAKTREERRIIMTEYGFGDVTKEELLEAAKDSAAPGVTQAEVNAVGELSDAELESVAGGETTLWLSAVTVLAATTI